MWCDIAHIATPYDLTKQDNIGNRNGRGSDDDGGCIHHLNHGHDGLAAGFPAMEELTCRMHKKGITEEVAKKRSRKNVKVQVCRFLQIERVGESRLVAIGR
jgi:hypothetical protein